MAVCQRDCSNVRWLKREINFFLILLLGMSHGFIILTLKKNNWACNTGTLHLLALKNSTMPSAGKILLTVFWDSQRVNMTEFLEAGNNVNSAHWNNIKTYGGGCVELGGQPRILLLHDNARPHTARAMIEALETLKFEVLSHPPYSPDLAPSDFHFFPHLKRDLKGTHFTSYDEAKQAVTSWIKQRAPEFFIGSMR